ncbi:hypothetical protein [Micromonospora mirobrigensis]|uniref:Uncharacterized protein n=1 Tax=Micromonospora mirobrigensis TaxID=262898 RepID=A0A1C4UIZ0_9ACTN|nr:hypothetical protein [Micromonospora mirobrigensis]SCE71673.1 hypothetical protein GA0070564_101512 [Micromonospora mirobrigensis]
MRIRNLGRETVTLLLGMVIGLYLGMWIFGGILGVVVGVAYGSALHAVGLDRRRTAARQATAE